MSGGGHRTGGLNKTLFVGLGAETMGTKPKIPDSKILLFTPLAQGKEPHIEENLENKKKKGGIRTDNNCQTKIYYHIHILGSDLARTV